MCKREGGCSGYRFRIRGGRCSLWAEGKGGEAEEGEGEEEGEIEGICGGESLK